MLISAVAGERVERLSRVLPSASFKSIEITEPAAILPNSSRSTVKVWLARTGAKFTPASSLRYGSSTKPPFAVAGSETSGSDRSSKLYFWKTRLSFNTTGNSSSGTMLPYLSTNNAVPSDEVA